MSLHLALNDATRGFLDRAKLEKTKPGVIIVNTARAGVVDEPALIELLGSGRIGHYATDVFGKEPTPPDEPLLKLDNVTPDRARGLQHARSRDDDVPPRHRPGGEGVTPSPHVPLPR